ncbi:MAG TPA: hypothetical protein PLH75_03880 [Amaricoccus sp.]|uniref:hypothetical protein n=1 Tax=Amaricoccus sp. TaxID=1872485 RepID=UPI001DCC5922|nr:hypothetical protein [Amaricoccus sp.]MCB1375195.1 hypothetical protein [Paracoccaceae bacterium]MCB1401700.1 hypothetical protein [Paracoccaceae bacterium]HPG21913.1 hypothetical protein [Amaricoccus sp.]HRW15260.1 hypothetical protein [Amaricoccus sp.]
MPNTLDCHDYTSILAEVNRLSRKLDPIIRNELPYLLGRRKPSGLARIADTAGQRRLHRRGNAREMLPVIVDACSTVIEDGTGISGEWREVGWSDGGVDWEWHEITTHTEEARRLVPIRAMVGALIELLERIDDLVAAQREIGGLLT